MSLSDSTKNQEMLPFWKMEGCGNHFVVCVPKTPLTPEQARRICERHYGVGADGIMALTSSEIADFEVVMFNPDGSPMGMCGNGIRCAAVFASEMGLTDKKEIRFIVEGRPIQCVVQGTTVEVDMGAPRLQASEIPLADGLDPSNVSFHLDGKEYSAMAVSMGNPHAVIFVDLLPSSDTLASWGSSIEGSAQFPNRANVEFVKIKDRRTAVVKVWERNAGATLACGTAACAVVVSGVLKGILEPEATVELPGGSLKVYWDRVRNSVILSGYARKVFEGTIGGI